MAPQQQLRPAMAPKAGNFQPNGQQYDQASQQPVGPPSLVQHYPQPQASLARQPAPMIAQHQSVHATALTPPQSAPSQSSRLTLPLRDTPLLGPFRLEHDAQELHFRAYLLANCAQPTGKLHQHQHQHRHQHHLANSNDSLLASSANSKSARQCNWPELFQLTINQQLVQLDRSKPQHRAVDIFQYCQPGDNILEIQVSDCYCTHEFVLEAVDRPTLKAFMNSCFKSRLLSYENCLQKLRCNFGQPGFLMNQQQQQQVGIINEYISEFLSQQGIEQTKVRISTKCPLGGGRIRTPTRGHNCKHLQCFDLETFLLVNRNRSLWYCPICYLSIPFNMLELDQHQMNIVRAIADSPSGSDDILLDSTGQWQVYFAPSQQQPIHQHQHIPQQQQQPPPPPPPQQQQPQQPQQTAKSTGIYHPQAQSNQHHNHNHLHQQQQQQQPQQQHMGSSGDMASSQPGSQSLPRPMSALTRHHHHQQQQQQPHPGLRTNSPNSWDKQQKHIQHIEAPVPVRRPASASLTQQQQTYDRANDMPMTKRICTETHQPSLAPAGKPVEQQQYFSGADGPTHSQSSPMRPTSFLQQQQQHPDNTDDLSPLAAMERTIIQHEMGPPPFDPNSLTSTAPNNNGNGHKGALGSASISTSAQVASQNSPQTALSNPSGSVVAGAVATPAPAPATAAPAPDGSAMVASPAARASSLPAASPQQQHTPSRVSIGPDSPMQHAACAQISVQTSNTSISHPATPNSASILAHSGPETPATPSNSNCGQTIIQQQQQQLAGHSNQTSSLAVVDHQPMSNGSASAGSITSSSTMTPSGQSLGSVGMGGDSRCGTAPLQMNGSLALDDLMIPGGSQSGNCANGSREGSQFKVHSHMMNGANSSSSSSMEEKNEILMGKLMMESAGDSLLHRNTGHHDGGELALALEEAEWKQQLDRGKSEHLANFLNEPMMNKQLNSSGQQQLPNQHYHQSQSQSQGLSLNQSQHKQVHQHNQLQHQKQAQSGANKMLSGGLNPSDEESSPSASSPQHQPDHMSDYNNYLDCDAVDNGTGLPPDDSILDLFER